MQTQDRSLVMLNQHRPKIAQKMVLEALKNNAKFIYMLIHRQYGKTHLCYKIAESKLLMKNPLNPLVSISTPTIIQGLSLYKTRFEENLAPFKPVLDKDKILRFKRPFGDKGYVEFFGVDRWSDSDRGRTTVLNICDEYGSFRKGFFQQFIAPFGMVHNAPSILTGTTSRGPNHFKKEFEDAEKRMNSGDKDFFAVKWTIDDSLKYGEISQEDYDRLRKLYASKEKEHIWKGEFMMDWFAYMGDQIFGQEISQARETGRVGFFPHDPSLPVDTFWDIGVNGTAVWFRQTVNGRHRYINFKDNLTETHFQSFVRDYILPLSLEYKIRYNIFPHDMENREFMSPQTRIETARNLLPGKSEVFIKTRTNKPEDMIDFTRRHFDRCDFDEKNCALGLERLQNYVRKNGKPAKTGEEGKASHGADAFILGENCTDFYDLDKKSNDPYYESRKHKGFLNRGRPKKNWWSA